MPKHEVRCPQCLSARTAPCKVMNLPTAIVVGIGTFGLGLLVTIPWYLPYEESKRPRSLLPRWLLLWRLRTYLAP
jgi:hypothetical protein